MRPFAFHDPTARAIGLASVAIVLLAEWTLAWRRRETRGAPTDRGTALGIGLSVGIPIWIGARAWDFAPGLSLSDGAAWPFVVGLVLFWSGFALRWWAIRTLGRFFQLTVVVLDGHRVVQDGPYRWLRHPGYAGFLLILMGLGFAFDNLLSVALCTVGPALGLANRIRVEEQLLTQELGDDYRAYARRTRRLVPGVW